MPFPVWVAVVLAVAAVVGHACVLMATVNFLYGERISKIILKPVRLAIGLLVVGNPILLLVLGWPEPQAVVGEALTGYFGPLTQIVAGILTTYGLVVFPAITTMRLLRPKPKALVAERTETINLWKQYGRELVGNGRWRWAVWLPFNQVFRVDFTEQTLEIAGLPPEWDGL